MRISEHSANQWKQWMLPSVFAFSSLLNIGFYYLGLAFQENAAREYGFILGSVLFAVLTGLTFLYILWKERFPWYQWLLWGCVLLFFAAAFVYGFVLHGNHYLFTDYALKFIVFCLPAFFVGVCAAKWRTEQGLAGILEKMSFFAFPAALAYFMQVMFDANPFNWGHDLGMINYMPFAYTLLPLLMALVIRFADQEALTVPFINRKVSHPQIVRFFMIIVFWVAIYSSGTRGAMVCTVCFLFLLLLVKFIIREKTKPMFLVSGVMVAVLIFNLFVYAPTGMRWLGRMDMFLQGLLSGEIITSPEDSLIGSNIDNMVAIDPTNPPATTPPETTPSTTTLPATTTPVTTPTTTAPEASTPSATAPETTTTPETTVPETTTPEVSTPPEAPADPSAPIDLNNHGITNRGTLFKIALKEFQKSPIFGMGPGSFSVKYSMFPHNVILELLAETGIVGTAVIVILVLFALIRLIKPALKDKNVMYVLLFFITYAVHANCNGTIWCCSALLCALGYGITFRTTEKPKPAEHADITEEEK